MSIFVGIALPIRTHSNILEPIRLRILLILIDTIFYSVPSHKNIGFWDGGTGH